MWFDGVRQPNTLYVASVSRGKDSTAMLRAIQLMGWPLDAICAVDVWFDDDTPAELPPMVKFKDEWDAKCLKNFGIPVTRLCATTTEDKKHNPFAKPLKNVGGVQMHIFGQILRRNFRTLGNRAGKVNSLRMLHSSGIPTHREIVVQ